MNEPLSTNAGKAAPAPVAGKPAAGASAMAPTSDSSMARFGGHRGGGKKRGDGLIAGSPEAKEADRVKNTLAKQKARLAQRQAQLPPAIPPAGAVPANQVVNPNPAPAGGGSPLPVAAVAPAVPGNTAPVPWTMRLLEKPAKLLTRILDRLRLRDIFRRLDKSTLPDNVKAEIKQDAEWSQATQNDFATALADATAIELNKRQVGAQNAHWFNLGLSAGEMVLAHYTLCDRIDKLILEQKIAAKAEADKQSPPPAPFAAPAAVKSQAQA